MNSVFQSILSFTLYPHHNRTGNLNDTERDDFGGIRVSPVFFDNVFSLRTHHTVHKRLRRQATIRADPEILTTSRCRIRMAATFGNPGSIAPDTFFEPRSKPGALHCPAAHQRCNHYLGATDANPPCEVRMTVFVCSKRPLPKST
jgi:hypothetical protein